MSSGDGGLDDLSLMGLFRQEVEAQSGLLTDALLEVEKQGPSTERIELLMRCAHSIKGAARIVGLEAAVVVAHAMEDAFVTSQRTGEQPAAAIVDEVLRAVDFLTRISLLAEEDVEEWSAENEAERDAIVAALGDAARASARTRARPPTGRLPDAATPDAPPAKPARKVLRVAAERVDRIMAMAGLALVESQRVEAFSTSVLHLRQRHSKLTAELHRLRDSLRRSGADGRTRSHLDSLVQRAEECRVLLTERLTDMQEYDRRTSRLATRLYEEAVQTRMRPFSDATGALPRMVRDLARGLGRDAVLAIEGEGTPVDRDVLERIKAPLTHLIRNAVDHGVEPAAERLAAGKPATASIRLEAAQSHGMLRITVEDDGCGVDVGGLRDTVARRGLATPDVAARLSEEELLQFLFLPEFTMKDEVTEISGRGVGLDVVQSVTQSIGGVVRISSEAGRGVRFELHLPLTLSVARALIVEVGGQPFALPLPRLGAVLSVPAGSVERLEGRPFVRHAGRRIGLVSGSEVLEMPVRDDTPDVLHVVVVGDAAKRYGLLVDVLVGEREMVLQPLDPRLGKVRDVAGAAMLVTGQSVLVLDVDDLVRSIDVLLSGGRLGSMKRVGRVETAQRKRILVIDDSITVREVERKLLEAGGYEVDVAVDGMDGWNALRGGRYDLVVTDVDMPRMDGIELLGRIRADPERARLPVMIVSYKDREEDRRRGLEAGADYYLTKGAFQDETLLQAIEDMIGEAEE